MKPKTAIPGEALPPLPGSAYPPDAVPLSPSFVGDEHWGKGGRYVVIDGKRVPADQVPAPQPTPIEQPAKKGN